MTNGWDGCTDHDNGGCNGVCGGVWCFDSLAECKTERDMNPSYGVEPDCHQGPIPLGASTNGRCACDGSSWWFSYCVC